jgi:uncharacterized membrane protein YdbT with pleckstrin-like domain
MAEERVEQPSLGTETVIAEFRPSYKNYFCKGWGWWILLFTLLVVGIPVLLAKMLIDKYTNYTLTNQRLKIAKGIIRRRFDEVELYRVKDVTEEENLLQRLFGVGDIRILSAEVDTPVVMLEGVAAARALREKLRGAVEEMRLKRGVRQLDVDHVP